MDSLIFVPLDPIHRFAFKKDKLISITINELAIFFRCVIEGR